MKKIEIEIPDDSILVQEGDKYIIKKADKPKSWKEFCENYPIPLSEYYIDNQSMILPKTMGGTFRDIIVDKNVYVSKEEAKAFLALTQLRQLRKAWVGDWNPGTEKKYGKIYYSNLLGCFNTSFAIFDNPGPLTFPTEEMTEEFSFTLRIYVKQLESCYEKR